MALPRTLARAPGGIALAGLVATGVLLCLRAAAAPSGLIPASWHGLPGWMAGPLPGVGDGLSASAFTALFMAMCACYLVALLAPLDGRLTIAAIVTLHVAFLLAPPLLSSDIFGYIDWARLGALHGLDPYAHGSLSAPQDPAFAYFRWRTDMPSPYGPAFTELSYATTPLGLAGAFWAMKAACAAASLGVVALVASCARRVGANPVRAAAFFGLNPLLLVWAIGGGHNDLLATVAVMAAVWLLLAQRAAGGGALLTVAAALKASAIVVLPYAVIGDRERRRVITGIALTALTLAVVAFAVFGPGVTGFLQSNRDQQQMVARTSVPNQIGVLLGSGGITPVIRAVAFAALAAVVLWTLWRTWRGGDWISGAGWATLALIVCSAWLMPWYVVWLLPLAPLARDRRLVPATLLMCAYLVAVRTPF